MYFDNKVVSVDQYLRKISRLDRDFLDGASDHSYVRHWSAHGDSDRTRPARLLFMSALQRPQSSFCSEEIDINECENSSKASPFDNQRTKVLANELEHSLKTNLTNDPDSTELEDFPIENYSPQKRKIYRDFMEIINADILAKETYSGQSNEFIKRKIVTEKCARQLRIIIANTFCDFDIIGWIHQLILDKGNLSTVTSYLNILQVLRIKIPTIIDKILKMYSGQLGYGYLSQLLKKSWDPSTPILNQHKPKKLSGNPVLMMSSAGFDLSKAQNESSRFHFWTNNLNALCKIMYIPMNFNYDDNSTLEESIDGTLSAFKNNILEFKNHYPNRPVILAGWTIGALITCLVALEADVDAVICFGFSLTGVNGSRGGLDDPLLDNKVPTLFIVGQNSNMCSVDDIEDFRSRMRAVTGLVVVGGADDLLRISPQKMLAESITQEIVDRCILNEITGFLEMCLAKSSSSSSVVSSNPVKTCPPIREESPDIINPDEVGKRKRRRPKEYSPELISSRKRSSHSISKEVASVPPKSHGSPSSSRSSRKRRHHMSKSAKTSPDKRGVGRPPGATNKKKLTTLPKSIADVDLLPPKDDGSLIRTFKINNPLPKITPPPPPPEEPVREAKPAIPFALNILPKKNEPVDVEKAFGMDSVYLPRSLTPPEPEDNTISAEETENAVGELEGSVASSVATDLPSTSFASPVPSSVAEELPNTSFTNPISQIITASEKPVTPPLEQITSVIEDSVPVTSPISGPTVKPILISTSDAKKIVTLTATSSGYKTVFLRDKSLVSSPASHIKSVPESTFVAKNVSQISTPSASKTMITVPFSGGAPLLVSSQTLKTPSGKIFQFLSKSPASASAKDSVTPQLIATSHTGESSQKIINLSSFKDLPKKIEASSSSATLVKLTAPEKSPSVKHFQVVKPPTTKVDTAAEMIEKQLAIKALNESVGLETADEGSVAYAKPTTSIISRVVPRPGHPPYIRQSIIAHPPGRGRVRPILPNKIYQIYPK